MTSRSGLWWATLVAGMAIVAGVVVACGGSDGGGGIVGSIGGGSNGAGSDGGTPSPAAMPLVCDDSMKSAFKPDANTTVLLVKSLKKGDSIAAPPPTGAVPAPGDLCVVKLLVGPGHAGPAGAPSTTPGIGIEVWLPAKTAWNQRVHLLGGGGMAGGPQVKLDVFSPGVGVNPWDVAGTEGAVSATTDTGHPDSNSNFLMNPDGTINTVGWDEFSQRGIHEMTVKAKALAQGYYGNAPKYTYWQGGSTGGRQGMKQAQLYPEDFDGIIANQPSVNWSRFITAMLYGQIVTQRDLGGVGMATAQVNAVSNAAIAACDLVGGQHLGYLLDPSKCTYDPTTDASVLCVGEGPGTNATAGCVTLLQASAMNKVWYGMTLDGAAPSPSVDTGYELALSGNHRWYGYPRGSSIGTSPIPNFGNIFGPTTPATIATDLVALELQDPTLATPSFINATGNGADRWKNLSYAQLANAQDRGVALQAAFANINTDESDLSKFKARGGKLITMYGAADNLIPYSGFINYYNRVLSATGGLANVQSFYKFYLVPGMGHFPLNGTTNASANPPIPTDAFNYGLMTDWVEKGIAPGDKLSIGTASGTSGAICAYPKAPTYVSGDIRAAASYNCQ